MSIKAIHIVLISCAILLSIGFGVWSFMYARQTANDAYQVTGLASLAIGMALVAYGIHFIKKTKAMS